MIQGYLRHPVIRDHPCSLKRKREKRKERKREKGKFLFFCSSFSIFQIIRFSCPSIRTNFIVKIDFGSGKGGELDMSSGDLLNIQPTELKFPFELKKQSSCSLQLTNKTDEYVAFKVKTTNPKKYCVRPNTGIVLPGTTCDVTVTMQAQKESPPDMQCKDKFLLQSVIAPNGATPKEITPEMFNKEGGKVVEEFKLRVIYIPANPPSPVPEGSEEGSSPRASGAENGNQGTSLFDAVSRSLEEPREKSEAWSMVSKLTEEKNSAIQQNQKLRQELELIRKEISKNRSGGVSFLFVVVIGLLGLLVGFLVKKT